jgi:hypothetical protein
MTIDRKFLALLALVALAAGADDAPTPAVQAAAAPAPPPAAVAEEPPAAAEDLAPRGTMDHLELDPTAITGNRELPKVMVIVPWKKADLGDLTGRPANSLLNEVLAPVDREVFRRELRYFEALETKPET